MRNLIALLLLPLAARADDASTDLKSAPTASTIEPLAAMLGVKKWWQYDPTKWLIAGLSYVGLADNLKRVPDLWIQRSQVAMQFKRVERTLEARRNRPGDEQVDRLKARVAEEYAAFRKSVEDWGKVRDQWVTDRKQRLLQKWEETSFRSRLGEIEHGLRMQRRRLRAMSRTYA